MSRSPICDEAAEDAVISSAILSLDAWEVARDIVNAADFWLGRNRDVWLALVELDAKAVAFDAVTIAGHMKTAGTLERIGGTPELARLLDATPAVAHVSDHATRVAALARQRRVTEAARRIVAEGQEAVADIDAFCQSAEREIAAAIESTDTKDVPANMGTVASEVVTALGERIRNGNKSTGTPSGIVTLDQQVGNWETGMHVVAGRPGMGKSSLVQDILIGISEQTGKLTLNFSLEMPKHQMAMRALSKISRVPYSDIRAATVGNRFDELTAAAQKYSKLPTMIVHRPGASMTDVRSAIRRAHRDAKLKFGKDLELGAVAIDYVQLMQGVQTKNGNREQEISSITRGLTSLAGELGIPIFALSQLNRSLESRPDKRPQMSDLRESGAIEQDAESVNFVYRDDYYVENSPDKGLAEVITGKNRNGPPGTVKLRFRGEYMLFEDEMGPGFAPSDFQEPMQEPTW